MKSHGNFQALPIQFSEIDGACVPSTPAQVDKRLITTSLKNDKIKVSSHDAINTEVRIVIFNQFSLMKLIAKTRIIYIAGLSLMNCEVKGLMQQPWWVEKNQASDTLLRWRVQISGLCGTTPITAPLQNVCITCWVQTFNGWECFSMSHPFPIKMCEVILIQNLQYQVAIKGQEKCGLTQKHLSISRSHMSSLSCRALFCIRKKVQSNYKKRRKRLLWRCHDSAMLYRIEKLRADIDLSHIVSLSWVVDWLSNQESKLRNHNYNAMCMYKRIVQIQGYFKGGLNIKVDKSWTNLCNHHNIFLTSV